MASARCTSVTLSQLPNFFYDHPEQVFVFTISGNGLGGEMRQSTRTFKMKELHSKRNHQQSNKGEHIAQLYILLEAQCMKICALGRVPLPSLCPPITQDPLGDVYPPISACSLGNHVKVGSQISPKGTLAARVMSECQLSLFFSLGSIYERDHVMPVPQTSLVLLPRLLSWPGMSQLLAEWCSSCGSSLTTRGQLLH